MNRSIIGLLFPAIFSNAHAQENLPLARQFLQCSFYLVNYGKLVSDPAQLEALKTRVTLFSAIGAFNASSEKFVGDELIPAGQFVNDELRKQIPENRTVFLRERVQECLALMRLHREAYFSR